MLQEAFIRAYRKLPDRFESERQEAAWLYRVVYRCCLNELRSTRRRRDLPAEADVEAAAVPSSRPSRCGLRVRLPSFPPTSARSCCWSIFSGSTMRRAAAVLRAPRGTIAWRLNVARSRLRDVARRGPWRCLTCGRCLSGWSRRPRGPGSTRSCGRRSRSASGHPRGGGALPRCQRGYRRRGGNERGGGARRHGRRADGRRSHTRVHGRAQRTDRAVRTRERPDDSRS